MGIRQTLNENPGLTMGITAGIIVLALIFIFSHGRHPRQLNRPTNKAYFTDDDGATWFVDDTKNIPPFDHNGKIAVRAILFKCADGKPFVQRLEQFDDETKEKITKLMQGGADPLIAQYGFEVRGMMIKRKGDANWVRLKEGDSSANMAFGEIMQPKCPNGGNDIPIPIPAEADVKPPQ